MKYLEITFDDPASNLACDEALLDYCEAERIDDGLLRLWQPKTYFVVLGHANRMGTEVHLPACVAAGVPILRRMSGGGAVLQGAGCINYALVLDIKAHDIKNIQAGFVYVLKRHRDLVQECISSKVSIEGISDLAIDGRKFSGNSQYRRSRYVLVHGTFLVQFDLPMIERCLQLPHNQPAYRAHRHHSDFVTNINVQSERICSGLRSTWAANTNLENIPFNRIEGLVNTRYSQPNWSEKF
jgi:lipoate---protein ligase